MMLFNQNDSLENIWHAINKELVHAMHDTKHPYRLAVLSTIRDNSPLSRYVVLRHVIQSPLELHVYSDFRSGKIKDLETNNTVSLLMYSPSAQVQLSIKGKSAVHNQDERALAAWKKVPEYNKKAYTPLIKPGVTIAHPTDAHAWPEEMTPENFTVIKILPEEIEALQINNHEHLRARFTSSDNWAGTWIAP